jgi:repressor LexA
MLAELTKQQRKILDFICERQRRVGVQPTVREICDYMRINSNNGVVCHLKALEKKGYIRRSQGRSRSIKVLNGPRGGIPLLTLADIERSGGW